MAKRAAGNKISTGGLVADRTRKRLFRDSRPEGLHCDRT